MIRFLRRQVVIMFIRQAVGAQQMLVSFALPIPCGFNFVIDSLGVHTWPILPLILSELLVDSRKMGSTADPGISAQRLFLL